MAQVTWIKPKTASITNANGGFYWSVLDHNDRSLCSTMVYRSPKLAFMYLKRRFKYDDFSLLEKRLKSPPVQSREGNVFYWPGETE